MGRAIHYLRRLFPYSRNIKMCIRDRDTNEYSPQNNGKLFSEKMDLSFESRQDNLRSVLDKMQQIGIDAAERCV